MTRTKKKTLAVLMALSVVIPGSIAPTSEAAAKKVKLSKTKVSRQVRSEERRVGKECRSRSKTQKKVPK